MNQTNSLINTKKESADFSPTLAKTKKKSMMLSSHVTQKSIDHSLRKLKKKRSTSKKTMTEVKSLSTIKPKSKRKKHCSQVYYNTNPVDKEGLQPPSQFIL